MSLAVAVVLCAGFSSCSDDNDEELQNPIENAGGESSDGNDPSNPDTNEYGIAVSQEVDLGLSVNWAAWNIGATRPEEYGGYYAWGETEEKEEYTWESYKHCNGTNDTMTKYCLYREYGIDDNKAVLEPDDDVAHVKWGNGWRMPTPVEQEELKNNCTWTWITMNGVDGYKVTSKNNGNSIFLPAAGCYDNRPPEWDSLMEDGGEYWSNSLHSYISSDFACCMTFVSDEIDHVSKIAERCFGYSVRAVRAK